MPLTLAIDRQSLHYKYYSWIRRVWGFEEQTEPTSLCPYCQTMLWGSVFCVIFCVPMVLGWMSLKLFRSAFKLQNPVIDTLSEWGKKRGWMDKLDNGMDEFGDSPLMTGLLYFIMGAAALSACIVVLGIILGILALLGVGAWNIKTIITVVASACVDAGVMMGWLAFHGFYYIGWFMQNTYDSTIWLFTNGPLWYSIGSWVLLVTAWAVGIVVGCVSLCLLGIGFCRLPFVKTFGAYLISRFNGFSEAQVARSRRLLAPKEGPGWMCSFCGYRDNSYRNESCRECFKTRPEPELAPILKLVIWLLKVCVWPFVQMSGGFVRVKNKGFYVMSFGAIVGEYLWALKEGVCPAVTFVDQAQLQAEARISAQERMDQEARDILRG